MFTKVLYFTLLCLLIGGCSSREKRLKYDSINLFIKKVEELGVKRYSLVAHEF
jgi:hypothetical protein